MTASLLNIERPKERVRQEAPSPMTAILTVIVPDIWILGFFTSCNTVLVSFFISIQETLIVQGIFWVEKSNDIK
jgi:hypothetical protein